MEVKGRKQQKMRPGDWVCSVCGNHNYSFRQECNRCRTEKKEKECRAYATANLSFFQALFVENLMFDARNYLLDDFQFQKKCHLCQ